MLKLDEVKPMRKDSPIPRAVVLPIPRLVVRGEVFCGFVVESLAKHIYRPEIGSRVIVAGSWHRSGIVTLRPIGSTGAFAGIDGQRLKWAYLSAHDVPQTHGAFLREVDRIRRQGLFEWSQEAARRGYGKRYDFLEEWWSKRRPDCRVSSATIVDGEWEFGERCAAPIIKSPGC